MGIAGGGLKIRRRDSRQNPAPGPATARASRHSDLSGQSRSFRQYRAVPLANPPPGNRHQRPRPAPARARGGKAVSKHPASVAPQAERHFARIAEGEGWRRVHATREVSPERPTGHPPATVRFQPTPSTSSLPRSHPLRAGPPRGTPPPSHQHCLRPRISTAQPCARQTPPKPRGSGHRKRPCAQIAKRRRPCQAPACNTPLCFLCTGQIPKRKDHTHVG